MIIFPFVTIYSKNLGTVKRPFANVKLISSEDRLITPMLVDSGADVSVISYQTGLKVGLTLGKGEKVSPLGGIGGGISVVYRNLQMEIGEYLFQVKVAWSLSEDVPEILGRADVFDYFDIELKQSEGISIFRSKER